MPTALLTEQEYLAATWRPDREFLHGELIERNVGTPKHSRLQAILTAVLMQREETHGFRTFPDARVRLASGVYRIPDVCVVPEPIADLRYLTDPILVAEIVSPDDTFTDVIAKGKLYRTYGVEHVWILDPEQKRAFSLDEHSNFLEVESAVFQVAGRSPVGIEFESLFARL